MEFKVWVEGMPRVVCGVSLDTTCQDIVIALAHATGRTGRFSLIEKWRQNERPVPPTETPLRLLHKWGEYAADVQFYLVQNDPHSEPKATTPETGMVKMSGEGHEGGVKRSLTFTGVHSDAPRTAVRHTEKVASIREHSIREDNSDSMPSPILPSPILPNHHAIANKYHNYNNNNTHLPLSKSYDSLERPRARKTSPRRTPGQRKMTNNRVADLTESYGPRIAGDERSRSSQALRGNAWQSQGGVEERARIGEGGNNKWHRHDTGNDDWQGQTGSAQEPQVGNGHIVNHAPRRPPVITDEYVNLVRLVVSQKERLVSQQKDMSLMETDLSAADDNRKEDEQRLGSLASQIQQLERSVSSNEEEIHGMDCDKLSEEIQKEEEQEEDLKSQFVVEQKRLEICEKHLAEARIKISFFSQRLEMERARSEKHLDDSTGSRNVKSDLVLTDLNNELSSLESALLSRQQQLGDLELDLKQANMTDFTLNSPEKEKTVDESSVFKQLSRPASTNPMRRGENNSTTVITPPDGVWV